MIDELILYLVEQIGLDGEAGTEPDRLGQFISSFHQSRLEGNQQRQGHGSLAPSEQLVDEKYQAYIWKSLQSRPHIHVGRHVPGVIAQGGNRKRSTVTRKSERDGRGTKSEEVILPRLEYDWVDVLDDREAASLSLPELRSRFGKELRIVVEPEISRRLLTGSDVKNLLSPSSYKCLQIICRARGEAITSVDLGELTKYDQKTIFYLAKRLINAGLIVKFKAPETRTQANYFVATRFLDQCPLWLRKKNAESLVGGSTAQAGGGGGDVDDPQLFKADDETKPEVDGNGNGDEGEEEEEEEEEEGVERVGGGDGQVQEGGGTGRGEIAGIVDFGEETAVWTFQSLPSEVASVWLSSRPDLVRVRMYKLLHNSKGWAAVRAYVMERLGFHRCTKFERKVFTRILDNMLLEKKLERIAIVRAGASRSVAGVRMTDRGREEMEALIAQPDRDRPSNSATRLKEMSQRLRTIHYKLVNELTVEHQVVEAVAASGTLGTTLQKVMSRLNGAALARRAVEAILLRIESDKVDKEVTDLAARCFHSFENRKRVNAYFSNHAWLLLNADMITDEEASSLEHVGRFETPLQEAFFSSRQELAKSLLAFDAEAYRGPGQIPPAPKAKRGRPRKGEVRVKETPSKREGATSASSARKRARTMALSREEDRGLQREIDTTTEAAFPSETAGGQAVERGQDVDVKSAIVADVTPKTERNRPVPKQRVNLLALRRMHLLVDCIKDSGGAMDSLLVHEACLEYGSRTEYSSFDKQVIDLGDRKIREGIIKAAVSEGKLRQTKIQLPAHMSRSQRTVIYLSDIEPDKLRSYIQDMMKGEAGWMLQDTRRLEGLPKLQAHEVDDVPAVLPWQSRSYIDPRSLEDEMQLNFIRTSFFNVPSVVEQHYAHFQSPAERLKMFHLLSLDAIRSGSGKALVSGDDHILDLSYFWSEIPLSKFLHISCPSFFSEAVATALQNDYLKSVPLSEQQGKVKQDLGLSSSGEPAESLVIRLQSFVKQLEALHLASPCGDSEETCRKMAWQFYGTVPLYAWDQGLADLPVAEWVQIGLDPNAAKYFWTKFKALTGKRPAKASAILPPGELDFEASRGQVAPAPAILRVSEDLAQLFGNPKAWRDFFILRWQQCKLLHRFLSRKGRDDILEDEVFIERASFACLAPKEAVRLFLKTRSELMANRVEAGSTKQKKMGKALRPCWDADETCLLPTRKASQKSASRKRRQAKGEGRKITLEKARQLRQRRDADFEALIDAGLRDDPEAGAIRESLTKALRRYRKQYVEARDGFTLAEAKDAVDRLLSKARAKAIASKSGTAVSQRRRVGGLKKGGRTKAKMHDKERVNSAGGQDSRRRRGKVSRGEMSLEAKDLLRDSGVVLRARDRARGRSDWSAILQLSSQIPDLGAKASAEWRLRFKKLCETPAEEAYLSALERRWTKVFQVGREKGDLLDPDFPDATNFDLMQQIRYLRSSINKVEVITSLGKPMASAPLPLKMDESFCKGWLDEISAEVPAMIWESTYLAEPSRTAAQRLDAFRSRAFTLRATRSLPKGVKRVRSGVAEAAVKMLLTMPDQSLNEDEKVEFCKSVGEESIGAALERLLKRKVIKYGVKEVETRRMPGANFVFTDEYRKAFDFPMQKELSKDVAQVLEGYASKLTSHPPQIIEPIANDQEAASILTLMSRDALDCEVDVEPLKALRANHTFNARIITDEEIESLILVTPGPGLIEQLESTKMKCPPPPAHQACLKWFEGDTLLKREMKDALERLKDDVGPRLQQALDELVACLKAAGEMGLTAEEVKSLPHRKELVKRVTSCEVGLAFWAGYDVPRLVSCEHLGSWTVSVRTREGRTRRVVPRTWLDMHGGPKPDIWRQGLEAVVGWCQARPGISKAHLNVRLAKAFDRLEVQEMVDTLCGLGLIRRLLGGGGDDGDEPDDVVDDNEVTFVPTHTSWPGFFETE
ncbi:hypothetical protein IE53DRAFT_385940 [Violaceomyces palustris]|uniref:Uncharacterized protein n=1 Tax=Violaceomyces palustris TaxID=1673888 RepID=A0ACD0P0T9_9BASI|nr:hypothetical protein IE53DRAFT_385940 [Violaceomyces palustris]